MDKTRENKQGSPSKIDGIDGLVSKLGVEQFVKLVIEESFFFHPIIIEKRHSELLNLFDIQSPIPARKTTKDSQQQINGQWFFIESNLNLPIEIDKDGNQNVRKIIKEYTGYTIGEGKDSTFQNYIISHIWGRAFDPRYFTSLWNVVLIPVWANPDQGSVASLLQSTFQNICEKLYFGGITNWKGIQMQSSPNVVTPKDVLCGIYNLNILGENTSSKKVSLKI